MLDARTLAIFLPFVGAGLWGFSYALNERLFASVSISTYIFLSSLASAATMLILHVAGTPFKISFTALGDQRTVSMLAVAIAAAVSAWLITFFAIKNVSANYASVAEISYPLFTALFGYLLFERKLDWSMAIGAILIIAGSFLIVKDNLNGR